MVFNWEQIGAGSIAIGMVLGIIAMPWFLLSWIRYGLGKTPWKNVHRALFLLGIAFLLVTIPILSNQILTRVLDLGPLETMVEGERHITLTGWDRKDYSILRRKTDVVVLQMANADVTDETLTLLNGLNRLKELDLSNSAITDQGLMQVATLPKLESLRLANTRITDDGFKKHLASMPGLINIDVTGTEVASKTVREWKKERPERKALK